MRIALFGATGQLGAAVAHVCSTGHDVVAPSHAEVDVADDRAVRLFVARIRPDAIVNCVGYNDVDGAERHPVEALNVNAMAVRALARAACDADATFVHFSSDFVFDGSATRPYTEDDRPNPGSVYATSKLLGEWFAADAPRVYLLRVESLFGRAPGARPAKGSVEGLLRNMMAGRPVRAFSDRTVSPAHVVDVALVTRRLLEGEAPPGLYHAVNSGHCTWLEFAHDMAARLGVNAAIEAVTLDALKLPAPRPKFCALSTAKLAASGLTLPSWQDALQRYLQDVLRESADQVANRQA